MALSFKKLKGLGLPKMGMKLAKMSKDRKMPSISLSKPKNLKTKDPKPFDFAKYSKLAKQPKAKKLAIIKKTIKKAAKPKGF